MTASPATLADGLETSRVLGLPVPEAPVLAEFELVLARFRLLAHRRASWLQHLWAQEQGGAAAAGAISHAEVATILADGDSPEAESDWLNSHEPGWALGEELARVELAMKKLEASRFARLKDIFGLNQFEQDLLQACAAIAWDPALARVTAYLHDNAARPYITAPLVARLCRHGRDVACRADSALFRWDLLRCRDLGPGESPALERDPQLGDWLRGEPMLDPLLATVSCFYRPLPPLAHWPVGDCLAWLYNFLRENWSAPARVIVSGSRGTGRRTFAAVIASQVDLPLLALDADQIPEADWRTVFLHAQRQAYLNTSALAWSGESLARRHWPARVAGFPLQFIICEPGQEPLPVPGVAQRVFRLTLPGAAERARLWKLHLPAAAQWTEPEIVALAERHRAHPIDIEHAARVGSSSPAAAAQAVRESARGRLGNLAQRLECPFGWDDLVLPAETRKILEAIAHEAETRITFWEQPSARRLFPQGQGLLVLLSGPPGTGKTMAAQVIAAHLKQDLVRVNLAQYVSKWVGETAKHCETLLNHVAEMDAVLFIDECDALLAKRSNEMRDAQDRFTNTDSAHLLQAIESFAGVALLATNLKGNIDPAFLRRLRYIVDFTKPDAAQRRLLWGRLVDELAGEAAHRTLGPALDALAASVEATAAQTKFALLGTLFAARKEKADLAARHLLLGLENELSKECRALSTRDRETILGAGGSR